MAYFGCRNTFPVVIKFDRDGAIHPASGAGAAITSVLIAYGDDDPAAAGCGTLASSAYLRPPAR